MIPVRAVFAVVLAVVVLGVVIAFPVRSYKHATDGSFNTRGFEGFSGIEKHPEGYSFAWALNEPYLRFVHVPRYTPLNLRLRINLERPQNVPPTRIELYENTEEPPGQPRLFATLEYNPDDPNSHGPHDFYITIPARTDGGIGLIVELKSNTFQVANDSRQLGFIFQEAELTLPRTYLLGLFWPNPYWPAALLLLAAMAAFALQAGLDWLETLLLTGLAGFMIITIAASTYQSSWWLLLMAVGMWVVYWWERLLSARLGKWSVWPLLAATALLLGFFLFSQDYYGFDIDFYFDWSASIHDHGVWNIYNQDKTLNYLPLIVYVLWLRNLIVYPLGLETSYMAWRVTASLMYLVVIALIYLTNRVKPGQKVSIPTNPRWLVLIAFNTAFFFNPTIWGQSDMLAVLALAGSFYLVYRKQPLFCGLALGLTAISKPQAWFVLPLLAWLLVQRCGWKRGGLGLVLGGSVALILAAIAFGLDPNAVNTYLNDPQLAGDYDNVYFGAFNFNYLMLGATRTAPPTWLTLVGFGVVGAVGLLVLYFSRGRKQPLAQIGLGGVLLVVGCYTWLIKMKERYLVFGFSFFGQAALQERRLFKPFLIFSWMQMLPLVTTLYSNYNRWRKLSLADYPYWWSMLLNEDWVRRVFSVCTLLLFGYLLFFYLKQALTPKAEIMLESEKISTPLNS